MRPVPKHPRIDPGRAFRSAPTKPMRLPILLAAFALTASAQDGGQLYSQYCSACHGPDGRGASDGMFPPLAGSEWVAGEPQRAIQVVLRGLQGPIQVRDRAYNLIMPPQGAVLDDTAIAAILSHVRRSWGNEDDAVDPATVAAERAASAERESFWTASDLLDLHPLPPRPVPIENLISRVYHGRFGALPDLSQREPVAIEEEADGKIRIPRLDRDDHFAIRWEGDLVVPEDGDYEFHLDADDGASLVLDGKEVLRMPERGPMDGERAQDGRVTLSAGRQPIRVDYFEFEGNVGIDFRWRKVGTPTWDYLSQNPDIRDASSYPSIPIEPVNDRAAIYRNFIEGTTPRAIGIGLPGGLNFAYSADHLAPELLWTGSFMDAGRHWTDRGQGFQAPAGDNILKLTGRPALPADARFRGYELDARGNPSFLTSIGDLVIRDSFRNDSGILVRKLRSRDLGDSTPTPDLLLAEGVPITADDDGGWTIAGALRLTVEGATAELRDGELRLPLAADSKATLRYHWLTQP